MRRRPEKQPALVSVANSFFNTCLVVELWHLVYRSARFLSVAREGHRDTPRGIGIGIALKKRVLALAGFGTISNVN